MMEEYLGSSGRKVEEGRRVEEGRGPTVEEKFLTRKKGI